MIALVAAVVLSTAAAVMPASPAAPFSAPGDDLSSSTLSGLDLSRRDFSHSKLDRAELRGARMVRARLHAASLFGADAVDVDFSSANLTQADLRQAVLSSAALRGADLREADFRGADCSTADFTGAHLLGALYDDATRLPFSQAEAFRRGMIFLGRRIAPFDETAEELSFKLFKLGLSSAVARKDVEAVSARLSKGLRQQCYKNKSFTCWEELKRAVEGGGLFTDATRGGFWAPYDAALWPHIGRRDLTDNPAAAALVVGRIETRQAPSQKAAKSGALADEFAVVTATQAGWGKVEWPGGGGWVPADALRFPALERRVWFGKQGDEWRVVEIAPVPTP